MKINGMRYPFNTMLLSLIFDTTSMILWMNSEDGRKNRNRPKSLATELMRDPEEEKYVSFQSGSEFDQAWNRLTGGVHV